MRPVVLKTLNAPILVIILTFLVAIQSSLFNSYPLMYLQPDVVLVAVVWSALRRDFAEGGVLTLILANIAEIHSGAPQGLYLACYMAVYLAIRILSRFFLFPNLTSYIGLTLGASIFWKLLSLFILHLLGLSANQWRHTLVLLLPGAVMVGIVSIWLFRFFERFDWVTYKNPKAKHADDDILIDEEGWAE